MTTQTLLLVCDDRGLRGVLSELLERTGVDVEEASSRYDLAGIVEESSCSGAFVALSGLKKDLAALLESIAEDCPGLPVAILGPGGDTDAFVAMLRARVVVDYVQEVDEAAMKRMAEEARRAPVGGAEAAPPPTGSPIKRMVEAVQDGSFHLPALGDTMARLQGIGDSESADIADVEAVVGADAALVGAVLQEANSSLFGGMNPVTSLRAACMRLGLPRVLSLAREALMAAVLPTKGDVAAIAMATWDRSLLSRKIGTLLAADVGLDAAQVNDSMLMHDVGELALLKVLSEVLGARSLSDSERQESEAILAKNHEAVGAMILKSWGMPMELVRLAACHHGAAPRWPETRPQTTLRTLAQVADLAAAWTLGEREEGPDAALLQELGLTSQQLEAMSTKAVQALESAA